MSPRRIRRMIRLTDEENDRLLANADAAGLEPAVYARLRALGEPTPARPRGVSSDVLFHADRAATTCIALAKEAANVGDLASANRLNAAAAQFARFTQRMAHDPTGK